MVNEIKKWNGKKIMYRIFHLNYIVSAFTMIGMPITL